MNDTSTKTVHDPVVKGTESHCFVICPQCGYKGRERPERYGRGVLKLDTSRANANGIARKHRKEHSV